MEHTRLKSRCSHEVFLLWLLVAASSMVLVRNAKQTEPKVNGAWNSFEINNLLILLYFPPKLLILLLKKNYNIHTLNQTYRQLPTLNCVSLLNIFLDFWGSFIRSERSSTVLIQIHVRQRLFSPFLRLQHLSAHCIQRDISFPLCAQFSCAGSSINRITLHCFPHFYSIWLLLWTGREVGPALGLFRLFRFIFVFLWE